MAERPLLKLPRAERRVPTPGRPPMENVQGTDPASQKSRVGPKFARLEETLSDPKVLGELREDPSAIVPERAVVFEVASDVVDFYRAVRGVAGLEFLGEDEGDAAPDQDFFLRDNDGEMRKDKLVPRRFYFTIPDRTALRELVSLWNRHQRGEELEQGRRAWRDVFGHLADIRPWGPKDRLTEEAVEDWRERLEFEPDAPVTFELEFWYRDSTALRERAQAALDQTLRELGGELLDRAVIGEIRYHAALVRVRSHVVRSVLDNPDVGLAAFDEVMVLRPQSVVSGPLEGALEDTTEVEAVPDGREVEEPVAALLDGVPMAQHERLADRLVLDDPDEFADEYGSASEQRHGTAMASLILHGDLNAPGNAVPLDVGLYVRPVLYPQRDGFDSTREMMPPNRLGIDLIWRAFIRMFDGEGGDDAVAPSVRIVNLSLGDEKRRFAGVMSPWARLIDYLAWRHKVLILVSAGNITDRVPLEGVDAWADFENATPVDRQTTMLRAVLRQRACRGLLSPSEAVNALTIGAAHADHVAPNGQGAMAVDPYACGSLPNLSSALGLGFKRTIKPEVLFPGGSEQVQANSTGAPIDVRPISQPARYFGIGVASPGTDGQTNRKINMSGTSVSTALATHYTVRILRSLGDIPADPVYPDVDPAFQSVLLKALMVHSARWDPDAVDALKDVIGENGTLHWEHERDEVSRFLGFGCPDVERVIDCAESRATLIGWNTIGPKETDRYDIPLPVELEGVHGFRALNVTIGWLTPITHSHRMYRLAKFRVGPGGDKNYSIGVSNAKIQPSHNALGKGTIYHHRWEGEDAADFVNEGNLVIDVTCSPAAGELDEDVPYGVAVTLEVGPEIDIQVYERIRDRLRVAVRVVV